MYTFALHLSYLGQRPKHSLNGQGRGYLYKLYKTDAGMFIEIFFELFLDFGF